MINHQELKKRLNTSPRDEWDLIVSDAIEADTSVSGKLKGRIIGFNVDDIAFNDENIEAHAYYVVAGDDEHDDDGPYQDDDGNFYDQDEKEYSYFITISGDGTTWIAE